MARVGRLGRQADLEFPHATAWPHVRHRPLRRPWPGVASSRPTMLISVLVLLPSLSVGLAACSGGAADDDSGRAGGTLKIVGSSDVERLDPASANSVGVYGLNRTYVRALFGNLASNNFDETVPVQTDVAAEIPTKENGGISKDGKTYTVHLRSGVLWNTKPAREVVADDFIRGLKRLCNPASPAGGKGYYTTTIVGMQEFCDGYAKVDPKSAKAMAGYQNGHSIDGVKALDDRTLIFKLKQPASDFLNILSLQSSGAAPKEYDRYIPDSADFRQNTISAGPYQIVDYRPRRSYLLERNPAWRGDADPLREQHVARIQITLGQDSPETVQQQLEQGTADLSWDQSVPASAIPRLRDAQDPGFAIREAPSNNPYLVFNTRSPNNGGALGDPDVRRAIEYAVDRTAVIKIYGGPEVARPAHTVIPPGNAGYFQYDLYPTAGESGDPAQCRWRLAKAGYPNGLTLKFPYRTNAQHQRLAEMLKEDLADCGIKAQLSADSNGDFYGHTLADPDATGQGAWDIAAPGWTPDWYGNNGRSVIQPLFDGRTYGRNSANYGGYNNPIVNGMIDAALTAKDASVAAGLWYQVDHKIMEDAVIVPLVVRGVTLYHSRRVHNALFVPTAVSYDYTKISLS